MMEIYSFLKKVAHGLSFAEVVSAMGDGMADIWSCDREQVDLFLFENGLQNVPCIFMANHSIGGRKWSVVKGHKPVFFSDPSMTGGWFIFREEDVDYLFCSSAKSGSNLTAEKEKDKWVVTLEVPIGEDGKPYRGIYWDCFHKTLVPEKATQEVA
jgi:hypothetical protein